MEPRYFFFLSSLILGLIIGLSQYRKLTIKYKLLLLLVFSVFLINGIFAKFLAYQFHNNHLATHIIIPIQCLLFGYIYSLGSKNKLIIISICFLTAAFSILNTLFLQSYTQFPSNTLVALYSVMIPIILFDMLKLLDIKTEIRLVNNPDFWLNLGGLVFFSATYFTFGLLNLAINVTPSWVILMIAICNIFLYLCYAFAIHRDAKIQRA